MHARVPLARSPAMDRYPRILLGLILVGATAACAAATDEPASPTDPVATATASPPPMPSASAHDMGATASHDMSAMDGDATTVTVDIANFAFAPAELRIATGTTVVFTNSDRAPHTATAGTDAEPTPERFDTGLLQPGETFTVLFDEPGTYAYFCERHPPMTGLIVVEG
jgi:plastocyanin